MCTCNYMHKILLHMPARCKLEYALDVCLIPLDVISHPMKQQYMLTTMTRYRPVHTSAIIPTRGNSGDMT